MYLTISILADGQMNVKVIERRHLNWETIQEGYILSFEGSPKNQKMVLQSTHDPADLNL